MQEKLPSLTFDNANVIENREITEGKNANRRIVENAIEIASECLEALQDHFEGFFGRDVIISSYIYPWAIEAEKRLMSASYNPDEITYYEFISQFVEEKLSKL